MSRADAMMQGTRVVYAEVRRVTDHGSVRRCGVAIQQIAAIEEVR